MQEMLQLQLTLHQKSRDVSYPASRGQTKYRGEVPDERVPWQVRVWRQPLVSRHRQMRALIGFSVSP